MIVFATQALRGVCLNGEREQAGGFAGGRDVEDPEAGDNG